jgi:hypothetical protein
VTNNQIGIKVGDCFFVNLPEYKSKHTPDRCCVVIDVDYKNNEVTIVPFSRDKDREDTGLTVIPPGKEGRYLDPQGVRNLGGRDSFGYVVPRLKGYCSIARLRGKLGTFNQHWINVIKKDLDRYPHPFVEYN